jgi:uncharacterized oligopeptide transporter (OPT) family protein
MGVPVLPFAIGLYLPLQLSTGMMLGGLSRFFIEKKADEHQIQRGILASSGLVAGDACFGVIVALLTVLKIIPATAKAMLPQEFSLFFYILLGAFLAGITLIKKTKKS